MKPVDIELPSNRKFGLFFTLVFLLMTLYIYFYSEVILLVYLLVSLSFSCFICALLKPDLLLPFNKLWMKFGLFLGMLISPIIMAFIFFIIFSPYGLMMRLLGRDQLRLKKNKDKSNWISRLTTTSKFNFKQQF
ncbi:SxtJ family membrane protein [Alphaproteobacteria bacterium]|nr:SxtJ family membrane protein [Alphaproteobacteria bacterium]